MFIDPSDHTLPNDVGFGLAHTNACTFGRQITNHVLEA
jgi:hypothetical protein